MNETKKPEIRFQGFSDEWEDCKLIDEVFSIDTGKSKFIPHKSGKYEILGSTSVIGYDDSYDYEGDFLLTARVGANAGDVYRHSGKVKISDNTVFIQGNQLDFIYYALLNFDIKKLSFGTGQPLVKASELREQIIAMPPAETEREHIGEFFSYLDNLIALYQRKCEKLQSLKACMLEKMFPKDGADVPEVRFKGFTGAWKTICLKDVTSEVTRTDKTSSAPIMMITAANGFIDQSDRYSFDNAGESLAKYIVLKKGELAYNHGASKLRPFGSCFALEVDEARIPYVYHCFVISDHNPYFVSRILNNKEIEKQLRRLVTSGARMDGLLNISYEEYTTIKIKLPEKDEQDKMEAFFKNIENLIRFSQQELDKLQSIKKALLEKMFV